MEMSRSLYKSLSAGAQSSETVLFRLASVCSALLYAGMALIFWLEHYHFRLNKATMMDKVKRAGFSTEGFEACMDSCMLMSGLSLLFLLLDFLASYACLWLSRRMRKQNKTLGIYVFAQYLAHCISICLLSVLKPSTPSIIDAVSSDFTPTLLFLASPYFFYAIEPYALVPFTLGHELLDCLLAFYRMCYLTSRPIETAFTQSSYLTEDFVDQVKKACTLLGIRDKSIYIADDDSRDVVVSQSMFENRLIIPLRAITFFQDKALLAEVLGRLFDLHNSSPIKAKLCMALIKLSTLLAYVLLMHLMRPKPNHTRLEILSAQKIVCILHFPGAMLLNCFLRHLERLSDEFVWRQGLRDNAARLFSQMGQNEERVYNPYYTGIVGLLSPTASFITRMERMS